MVEHAAVNRRVVGSSPTGGARLRGQAVKTPPFHGGNRGSIPLGVTSFIEQQSLAAALILNTDARKFSNLCPRNRLVKTVMYTEYTPVLTNLFSNKSH